jgi:hypothetical protein
MNARGWLDDGVDLALVGAVALWIGVAGAFLASLSPVQAGGVQNLPAPPAAIRGGDGKSPAEVPFSAGGAGPSSIAPSLDALDVTTSKQEGRIPEGAFSCGAEDGAVQNLPAGFLDRLALVESGGDDGALGPCGGVGRYQIRADYLADGNAAAGTSYTLEEMREPDKAATVVRAYLGRYGAAFARRAGRPATAEELARIHNGGPRGAESPRTLAYARAFAATEGGRP